jgi:hypothetical protein
MLHKSEEWWHTPIVQAFMRLSQKDCEFKTNVDCTMRPSLKTKLAEWLKWYSTYLPSTRPSVQPPVPSLPLKRAL